MSLKPFNLERALAGDPVIAVWTGQNKVGEIHVFKKSGSIGFVIEGKDNVCSCDLEGKQGKNQVLFMALKKETWWFIRGNKELKNSGGQIRQSNLYQGTNGEVYLKTLYRDVLASGEVSLHSIEIEN